MDSRLKLRLSDSDLPAWVGWIAQDKSGVWWGFEQEPNQGHDFWYENEVGQYLKLFKTEPNADWRKTLQRI